jgi:hypothetical protein
MLTLFGILCFESGDVKYRDGMVKANELYETPLEVL